MSPDVSDAYALTGLQHGMVIQKMLDEHSSVNVLCSLLRVPLWLDDDLVRAALDVLAARHDALRTVILYRRLETPRQVVLRERAQKVSVVDLRDQPDPLDRCRQLAREEAGRGFDLERDPLLRLTLVHLGAHESAIVWTMHHIVVDGWNIQTLCRDFFTAYEALAAGQAADDLLAQARMARRRHTSYGDYVRWLDERDQAGELAYWRTLLDGYTTPVGPMSRPTGTHGSVIAAVPADTEAALRATASGLAVTMNTLLETAWGLALQRVSQREDAVFGKVVSGRDADLPGIGDIVGLFANTIPVRARCAPDEIVADLVRRDNRQGLDSARNAHCPLAQIQAQTRPGIHLIRSLYVYENQVQADALAMTLCGQPVSIEPIEGPLGYPLGLKAYHDHGLRLEVAYAGLDAADVRQFADQLVGLLAQIAADPHGPVADLRFAVPSGLRTCAGEDAPSSAVAAFTPPRDRAEQVVADVFRTALGLTRPVGVDESFLDLGGHSLKAARAAQLLERASGVAVPLRCWFTTPTVAQIAQVVRSASAPVGANGAIPVAAKRETYAVSPAQRRMYTVHQLDDTGTAYNIPLAMRFRGSLDADRLQAALDALQARHESLRTCFRLVGDEPEQVILPVGGCPIRLEACPGTDDTDPAALLDAFVRPFDLGHAPLLRAGLARGQTTSTLLLDMHHIIGDGQTETVLLHDLAALYNGEPLDPARQYKDFSEWARTRDISQQQAYWEGVFAEEVPVLDLIAGRPRPARRGFDGAIVGATVPAGLRQRLDDFARTHQGTPFMVLLAALGVLVSRYATADDITIGSPVSGRVHPDTQAMAGMFINTVAIRSNPGPDLAFTAYFDQVRQRCLDAVENQEYPFESLVEQLDWLSRDFSRNPLFDVMFSLQNQDLPQAGLDGLDLLATAGGRTSARFDLSVNVSPVADTYQIDWVYSTQLFDADTAQRMLDHYVALLASIVADPARAIRELPMMDDAEADLVTRTWSGAAQEPPQPDATDTVALIVRRAQADPDHIALACGDDQVTYADLIRLAGQLADDLRRTGTADGDIVAILGGHTTDYPIAALGIMMAGAAFLPIDATWPDQRCQFILSDSGATALVLAGAQLGFPTALPVLTVPTHPDGADREHPALGPDHLAYCIYTSGTTGQPKGALLNHRGLLNLAGVFDQTLGVGPDDTVLQFASCAFDASVFEVTMALTTGATLQIVPAGAAWDPTALRAIVARCTIAIMPPQLAALAAPSGLRLIMTAGSAADAATVRQLAGDNRAYINGYGPTEATVCASLWHYDPATPVPDPVPIGRPAPGVQIYILDGTVPCAIGVPGELCIGGAGVARGYLGRDELTAARFVPNPFGPGRLYRSADRACWRPDGTLAFLGRLDDQVKVRGYRIEPGEIEAVLRAQPGVDDAAVVARPDAQGQMSLAAFVVGDFDTDTVRAGLLQRLPAYMVPDVFTRRDALPVTTAGKTDRAALVAECAPAPSAPVPAPSPVPQASAQDVTVGLFRQLLGYGPADAGTDFFAAGGDSIKAIRMVSHFRDAGFDISVREIMSLRTARDIARALRPIATGGPAGGTDAPVVGEVALTPIQRQFFRAELAHPEHFNQAVFWHVPDRLDESALRAALSALAAHHDMLRAVYTPDGRQHIRPLDAGDLYALSVLDLPQLAPQAAAPTVAAIGESIQANADLEHGPLLRAGLFRLADGDHLLLVAHHLIIDGVSWRILCEDLWTCYQQGLDGRALRLPAKTASFREWADLLAQCAAQGPDDDERAFWATAFDPADDIGLPAGTAAPGTPQRHREIRLDAAVTDALAHHADASINGVLTAGLALAALRVTGQRRLGFELEGHGRHSPTRPIDIDRTVGWFTCTFPVTIGASENLSQLVDAAAQTLAAVPHGGVGFGLLPDDATRARPRLSFNYLGELDAERPDGMPVTPSPLPPGSPCAPGDTLSTGLAFNGQIVGGQLAFDVAWAPDLFDDAGVEAFCAGYAQALADIAGRASAELDEISALFEGMA